MRIVEGGQQPSNAELLERVVRDRVAADSRYRPVSGLGVVMHGNVVELMEDQAHLTVEARIPLQISCRLCETGIIIATFPSPRIVPPSKRDQFLALANAVNVACVGVGGLVLDDLDLAFMAGMPYKIFRAAPDEAGRILLTRGVDLLDSIALAALSLSVGDWSIKEVLHYVDTLYTNGYVNEEDWF